jgi:hypothetical protein
MQPLLFKGLIGRLNNILCQVQIMKLLIMEFSSVFRNFSFHWSSNIIPGNQFYNTF